MLQFTGAESEMRNWNPPVIATQCVDCGLGTYAADEYPHTIKTEVWEQVWVGRRKSWRAPGTEILCIGCLEDRLGRRLTRADFTDAPCRTWQHGRHIDTLPLEPRQPSLTHPPAFPKLKVYGAEPWTVKRRP